MDETAALNFICKRMEAATGDLSADLRSHYLSFRNAFADTYGASPGAEVSERCAKIPKTGEMGQRRW